MKIKNIKDWGRIEIQFNHGRTEIFVKSTFPEEESGKAYVYLLKKYSDL